MFRGSRAGLLVALVAYGQPQRALIQEPQKESQQKFDPRVQPRVALAMGNGQYTQVSKLSNPVSDARAIGSALGRSEERRVGKECRL